MGNAMHFLPSPNQETVYDDGFLDVSPEISCVYGAASMHGWRKKQEDRFTCLPKFCNNISFFAVYDGHGGSEIAEYLQENLQDEIKSYLESEEDVELATYLAFLSTDLTLRHPEIISQLNMKLDVKNQEISLEKKKMLINHGKLLEELNIKKNDSSSAAQQSNSNADNQVFVPKDKADISLATGSGSTNGVCDIVSNNVADNIVSSSVVAGSESTGSTDASLPTTVAVGIEDDTVSSSASEIAGATAAAHESEFTSNAQDSVSSSTAQDSGSNNVSKDSSISNSTKCSVSAGQSVNQNNVSSAATSIGAKSNVEISVAGPSQICDSSTEEDTEIDEDSYDENMEEGASDAGGDHIDKPLDYLLNEELESSDSEDEDFFYGDDETESEGSDDENTELGVKKMTAEDFANMQPGDYSGSTATIALLDKNTIYVANVGDSKCVLSHNGLAIDMSVDHKPTDAEEHERIVRNGGVVRMGRINDSVDMSRAFGDFRLKGKSEDPPQQCVTAEPFIKSIPITKDDEFLVIASDGIWNSMTSQEVVDYINMRFKQGACDLKDICDELFQLILAPDLDNDGTGCDNMTCIIIKFATKNTLTDEPPSESHTSVHIDSSV